MKQLILTALLLGTVASTQAASLVTSTTYNGHTYELWDQKNISWNSAEANAVGRGGYLAVLTDSSETSAVYGSLINHGFFKSEQNQDVEAWLGGRPADGSSSTTDPNNWAWVTGESWTAFDLGHWSAGEPNGDSEGLAINRFAASTWNDEGGHVGGYIVEIPRVPEAGNTAALLGSAVAGLAVLRRKLR